MNYLGAIDQTAILLPRFEQMIAPLPSYVGSDDVPCLADELKSSGRIRLLPWPV